MINSAVKSLMRQMMIALMVASTFGGSLLAQSSSFGLGALRGSYAMHESGSLGSKSILTVGVITFSGSGTASGTATGLWNGTDFVNATFTGFANLNPDGTGTMELVFSYPQTVFDVESDSMITRTLGLSATYSLVVVNGNQVIGLRSTNGQGISLRLEKQVPPTP